MVSKSKKKPKKLKKSRKPKKLKKSKTLSFSFKPRRIRIKVIGIGGGGSSIVSEIARSVKKTNFLIVDSDHRVAKKGGKNVKVFQFGEDLTGGLGTGMNVDLGEKIARKEKEKIARMFKDQDLVILIASLGGGFASGAAPVFAEIAKDFKNISLGIFTLPFRFEGEKKLRIAEEAVGKIKENLSGQFVIANERIFQIIDKKTPLKKALSSLNRSLILMLEDLIEMISKPGLINIDFADLRTILKGRGRLIYFGSAFSQGPNRAEEAVKKVFQNPLSIRDLGKSRKILFNIKGGKDLTLREVERISSGICSFNRTAKIIFGISQDPKCNGKIKLTLLEVGEEKQEKKKTKSKLKEKELLGQEKTREKKKKPSSAKMEKKEKQIKVVFRKEKKKKIRRSGLEIRKAKKEEEEQEWTKEPEWEIPAFLRKKSK
jgi:cell division protein FtsZ